MSKDLDVIRKIEKNIGQKLKEVPLNKTMGIINGFSLDDASRVVRLALNDCNLTDISVLQSLTQINTLYLDNNQLTDISVLQSLTQMADLSLVDNQLTDISALQSLTQLNILNLSHNQLTDISALQSLTQLKSLSLGGNHLTDISALQSLIQLNTLWLNHNKLTDISVFQSLSQLNTLDLKNNKISCLPTFITQWDIEIKWEESYSFEGLNLYCNPLETPPVEIVKQGMDAMRNYFSEMEQASALLLQAKLLFVGSGEVGKTTLMRTLTETGFQLTTETIGKEETTHGIHIKPWELTCPLENDTQPSRNLTLHTWDFGGQDIYLSTHQFFLTKRSLYIFVWEARREEQVNPFDYWLNVIKLLSDNSPVIVVMNKADVRAKPIDEVAYMDKFKNIRAFLRVSCLNRWGINDLCRTISGVLGSMDHLLDKLPASWQEIRTALEEEDKNYIDAARYYEICRRFGLEEQDRADHLGDYLHNLGAILRFRADAHLKNTLILKPEWATEAVYKLIDTQRIIDKKGRFHFDDLEKIWDTDKYPVDKHHDLIRLMEKFELCFNFTGTTDYIVPELVPGQRPNIDVKDFQDKGTLRFEYHYDFMPKGIVSRFIARNYYLIKAERFWQNGVELDFEDSTALVMGDPPERKLRVWVWGPRKTELLAIIRNDLNHIHGTLNMKAAAHYKEKIPCTCNHCRVGNLPYLYDYPMLLRRLTKGKTYVDCRESDEEVPIAQLLQGIVPESPLKEFDFTQELIRAAKYLQGKHMSLRADEDSYTDFISTILEARGLRVDSHGRWGRSLSGKTIGRPDLRVINPEGETQAIVEAFRLKARDALCIRQHLEKMFNYDPTGCEVNYVLVYVENENFIKLWTWYKDYLKKIDFKHRLKKVEEIETIKVLNLRVLRTDHMFDDREVSVHHIFIRLESWESELPPPAITKPLVRARDVALSLSGNLFTQLKIIEYKVMENVTIENLNRINIFAGINNSGKSTLLEAIYLLIGQNDADALLETMRRRGKFCEGLNPQWMMEQFSAPIHLEGTFQNKKASVRIKQEDEEKEEFDKRAYLGTIYIDARFLNGFLTTKTRIFETGAAKEFFKSNKRICNAAFSSPFSMQDKEDLIYYHQTSVETRNLGRIIDFLRTYVDSGIEKIEYVGEKGRFLVTHKSFENPVDLTQFGEGVQRAFHITLQFAAARNGVLLIDELENAIHYSLLNNFAFFICELAKEFSTQVFLTSHNKECIEAFFSEGIDNECISAYHMERENGKIECKYISGPELDHSISNFGADLRG